MTFHYGVQAHFEVLPPNLACILILIFGLITFDNVSFVTVSQISLIQTMTKVTK